MRKMLTKKAAFSLLLLLVLTAAVPGALFAADNLVLNVSDAQGDAGDLIEIDIAIENASGTEGGQFVLNFDPEFLNPIALDTSDFLDEAPDSMEMVNLEYAPGQLMFIWVTAAADTEDSGILCTITFEVLKEGESLVEIDEVVISPEGIDTDIEPGLVTAPGDGGDAVTDTNVAFNESSTSPLVIVAAVAILAVAGYAAYRFIKKPGKEQA